MYPEAGQVVREDGASLYYSPYGWSTDLEGGFHFSCEMPVPPQEQKGWIERFLKGASLMELLRREKKGGA